MVARHAADGPYADFHQRLTQWTTDTYGPTPANLPGRLACEPEDVAQAIVKAVTSDRPAARYPVGVIAKALFGLRRPGSAFEAVVRNRFPVP